MDEKRYYTAREVTTLIPQLETIFEHIQTCRDRADALGAEALSLTGRKSAVDLAASQRQRSQMEFLLSAVQDDLTQIEKLGGSVKDLDEGLVDFLGEIDGHDIWLCWRRGETKVRFWHALEEGFSSRQALPPGEHSTLH